MMNTLPLIAFGVAFAAAYSATFLIRRWAPRFGLVDVPNERSSHTRPTPRSGGLAFVVVAPLVIAIVAAAGRLEIPSEYGALLLCAWLVAGVSLLDDKRKLPAAYRLMAQVASAALFVTLVGYPTGSYLGGLPGEVQLNVAWGRLGLPLAVLWLIGLTNVYNFMDGIDGLAGGQAVLAAAFGTAFALAGGAPALALVTASLAGGALGFLLHNWPPAKIFMGDVGSAFLGFTFAGLALLPSPAEGSTLPPIVWLVLLGAFLFDAGVTLARRVLNGERWYEAHRTHYYQRLTLHGWSHLRTTLLYLGIAAYLGLLAWARFVARQITLTQLAYFMLAPMLAVVLGAWRVEARAGAGPRGSFGQRLIAHLPLALRRSGGYVLADVLIVVVAYWLSLPVRFSGEVPTFYYQAWRDWIVWIVLAHLTVNAFFGLYQRLWRYASAPEAVTIAEAALTAAGIVVFADIIWDVARPLPISTVLMGAFISLAGFVGVRFRHRLLAAFLVRRNGAEGGPAKRVLIVGAGDSGQALSWQLQNRRLGEQYQVVGFMDDDAAKVGMRIHGLPILGDRAQIPAVVARSNVDLIVLAIKAISGEEFRELLSICQTAPAQIKIMPDLFDALGAGPHDSVPLLRDVSVEDLLGRRSVEIDVEACRSIIAGRAVMVTGAAGSIGSELCRQLAELGPRCLVALDVSESGLYELECDLRLRRRADALALRLADVTDPTGLRAAFKAYRPQVVFHAAAYKHVPLMETHPREAVRVNLLGTWNVARLAEEFAAERFVLVSSDKAVNPISVMGATKRACEQIVLAMGGAGRGGAAPTGDGGRPRYTAVRFGNVLNSRGSVVPTFQRQIEAGGPVTVTHPEMTRFFMSLPEAVRLVIQAAALTEGGDLFMLDMGERIRILDLAERMIRLRGLRPGADVPIVFTGVRAGEKMHEELVGQFEARAPTSHPHIYRIQETRAGVDGFSLSRVEALAGEAGEVDWGEALGELMHRA